MRKLEFLFQAALGALWTFAFPALLAAQDLPDVAGAKRLRLKDDAAGFWIYDDVARGYEQARTSGKPLLVSFRCVP